VIGVLSLQSCRAGTYGSKEQDILERLAVQIAPTLRHAQLYQDLEGRTAELAQANETITAMNELSRIITATPDIGAVYEQFAQAVKKLMDFERISINSVNRDEGVFTFQHVSGLTAPGRNPGDSMPLAGSQMEKAILSGQHQVRHDITVESSGSAVATMVGVGVRSSILVPLIVNGEVIGGLALWSRRPNAYGAREQETLQRLARQIAPSIQNARLFEDAQRETQRAAAALAQLHAVLEGVDAGIVLVGEDNQTVLWGNRRMGEFLGAEGLGTPAGAGITESDLRRLAEPMLDNPAEFLAGIDRIYQDRERTEVIENVQFKGPHPRVFRLFTTPVYGGSGSYLGRLWVATDVTEQQHLESQVRQSQKMDTVGRLAGGVAHDFNNLLTAILGYAQLGIAGLPQEHPSAGHFKEVEKAAQRAANLTSQLLAFSRHQAVEAIEVDLNHLVMEMHPMLRRLIGDSVELVTLPDSNLPLVKVDHGQMEQVVMNLVVNARDAMPHGGKITIQTVSLTLDARDAAQIPGAAPGHYALLTVADTGTGMTQEVKDHLFEPFFTTKGVSQGTGLGLATCHGIVRRAKGHIQVESQLGRGSTLRIYLPAVACKGSDSTKDAREDGQPRGTETVLVVDDEAALRAVVSQTLGGLGYSVLEARDGFEARRVSQAYPREPIQLLVTDLVMPNMGGIEVASRFKADFPEGKVLFISGYSEDPLLAGASGREDTDFLQKPFMPGTLARKVRDLLDRQPASTVPEALHG
jgi:signal transduction histidine kinase